MFGFTNYHVRPSNECFPYNCNVIVLQTSFSIFCVHLLGITECLQGNKDVDQYSLHDMEEGIQNISCFDWVCEKYIIFVESIIYSTLISSLN